MVFACGLRDIHALHAALDKQEMMRRLEVDQASLILANSGDVEDDPKRQRLMRLQRLDGHTAPRKRSQWDIPQSNSRKIEPAEVAAARIVEKDDFDAAVDFDAPSDSDQSYPGDHMPRKKAIKVIRKKPTRSHKREEAERDGPKRRLPKEGRARGYMEGGYGEHVKDGNTAIQRDPSLAEKIDQRRRERRSRVKEEAEPLPSVITHPTITPTLIKKAAKNITTDLVQTRKSALKPSERKIEDLKE